jgi:hypothetical protein
VIWAESHSQGVLPLESGAPPSLMVESSRSTMGAGASTRAYEVVKEAMPEDPSA